MRKESGRLRAEALQALADLAGDDPARAQAVRRLVARAAETGTPAMRARARELLGRGAGDPTDRRTR